MSSDFTAATSFSADSTNVKAIPLSINSADVQLSFKNPQDTGPGYYIDSITLSEGTVPDPGAMSRYQRAVEHILAETSDIPFSLQKGTMIRGTFEGETTESGLVAFDGEVSCVLP